MKLCVNCKHYNRNYKCNHPASIFDTNLVNGFIYYNTCDRMRENVDLMYNMPRCGVDAKLFEEKEPSLLERMMFWKKSTHKPD